MRYSGALSFVQEPKETIFEHHNKVVIYTNLKNSCSFAENLEKFVLASLCNESRVSHKYSTHIRWKHHFQAPYEMSFSLLISVRAYSHCTGMGQVQETGPTAMGPSMLYKIVHTGPRQGREPEFIVSYWSSSLKLSRFRSRAIWICHYLALEGTNGLQRTKHCYHSF